MKKIKKGLGYLATPYTCNTSRLLRVRKEVERERFETVTKVSILLFQQGIINLSPITQSHIQRMIAPQINIKLGGNWSFWKIADLLMLSVCSALYVLRESGWTDSTGVQGEIRVANQLGLPIYYVDYNRTQQTITITREGARCRI